MSYLWQRFVHFAIFVISVAAGITLTVFVYSNTQSVNLDWWQFHYTNVPLGMVALVPLLVGFVLGYLYHVPAGIHDFTQSMRKGHRITALEKENRELQHQLDQLLAMPDDSPPPPRPVATPMPPVAAPATPAAHAPAIPAAPAHEPRPVAKTRAVHEGKHEPEPDHDPKTPGKTHGTEHPTHREPAPSA
jgi:uncharacterized integral membrane protein